MALSIKIVLFIGFNVIYFGVAIWFMMNMMFLSSIQHYRVSFNVGNLYSATYTMCALSAALVLCTAIFGLVTCFKQQQTYKSKRYLKVRRSIRRVLLFIIRGEHSRLMTVRHAQQEFFKTLTYRNRSLREFGLTDLIAFDRTAKQDHFDRGI